MPTGVYERTSAHRANQSAAMMGNQNALGNQNVLIHGHSRRGDESLTHRSWRMMRRRCNDPNTYGYRHYGGRGIQVCKRWRSFELFLKDMGERLKGKTIDRIDNDGDYNQRNCRWATPKEQTANRRPRGSVK